MTPELLPMPDAEVLFYRQFFTPEESDALLCDLMDETHWKQESIRVPGRQVPLPRLTAWYGDEGAVYRWSSIVQQPQPWTLTLLMIKGRIESATQTSFNSVLMNLYRTEQDSVSWHADDEQGLGPVIASVSFGSERRFQFRNIENPKKRYSIMLPHGSLLIMRGETQQHWKHRVPKAATPFAPRINLTFRTLHAE